MEDENPPCAPVTVSVLDALTCDGVFDSKLKFQEKENLTSLSMVGKIS